MKLAKVANQPWSTDNQNSIMMHPSETWQAISHLRPHTYENWTRVLDNPRHHGIARQIYGFPKIGVPPNHPWPWDFPFLTNHFGIPPILGNLQAFSEGFCGELDRPKTDSSWEPHGKGQFTWIDRCSPSMVSRALPSGFIKRGWHWKISELNGGFVGKISYK